MQQYIGCDGRQRYSVFVALVEAGRAGPAVRVDNDRPGLRQFLRGLPAGAPVAVEASGGWYWLIDELEAAELEPHLMNPKEAKQRMRGRNKTDKLDATGLAILLRNGTLPEVWIPDGRRRDLRGLLRARLATRRQTTFLKNRISAAIRRYGLREDECSEVRHQKKYALAHVSALYQRLKLHKGHAKASVAVGRHLAEASWWMLSKHQVYREPAPATIASSKNG